MVATLCYSLAMRTKKSDDQYSPEEAVRRRDAILKWMLEKPPKPHTEKAKKRPSKSAPFCIQVKRGVFSPQASALG